MELHNFGKAVVLASFYNSEEAIEYGDWGNSIIRYINKCENYIKNINPSLKDGLIIFKNDSVVKMTVLADFHKQKFNIAFGVNFSPGKETVMTFANILKKENGTFKVFIDRDRLRKEREQFKEPELLEKLDNYDLFLQELSSDQDLLNPNKAFEVIKRIESRAANHRPL